MSEPTIHIRKIKDPQATGIHVELDETNPAQYCVTAKQRLEWLEALEAVTSFIETRERTGRDD